MKKFFLAIFIILCSASISHACPFCGCGNSNFQIGLLPTYSNAFVGVRYTYAHFNTLSHDGTQFSHDYFQTAEIWGGYKIGKVQLMAFFPYITSHKNSDDGIINKSGLGDALLLVNYQVFSAANTTKRFSQSLFIGGGVKLATGQSHVDTNDPDFTVGDFTSTPGTGSTDYLVNITHNVLMGNNGIVTNAAYRFNTANHDKYQYGNRIYLNAAFFHSFPVGTVVIRPNAGINLVVNETNRFQSQDLADSQGYVFSGTAGVNFQKNKLGLMINGFLPVSQNLYDHQTEFKSRISAALTFSF